MFDKIIQMRFTKSSSDSILLIFDGGVVMGDAGKKPLHLLVIDLMRTKTLMAGVSKCAETELLELGALLQASEWRSHEDITVAALLLRDVQATLPPCARNTKVAYLFLQRLADTLSAEAATMNICPLDVLTGMHPE